MFHLSKAGEKKWIFPNLYAFRRSISDYVNGNLGLFAKNHTIPASQTW